MPPPAPHARRTRLQLLIFAALVVPTIAAGIAFGAWRERKADECRARGGEVTWTGPRHAFPRCEAPAAPR